MQGGLPVKILHVNYNDSGGGSAKSVYRLHQTLLAEGVDSQLLVSQKQRREKNISGAANWPANLLRRVRLAGDKIPLLTYRKRDTISFSTQRWPNKIGRRIRSFKADLVNLHWVGHGMLPIESLDELSSPLVWTLHDMWPISGGCHVHLDCLNYRYSCGRCPQLGSKTDHDLSNKIWLKKQKAWRKIPLTLVAPSRWMAELASESELLPMAKIEMIPHGVDTQIFRPLDKGAARESLALPQDKQIILFGAAGAGRHKGFALLKEAAISLSPEIKSKLELIIFGPQKPGLTQQFGFPVRSVGPIDDENKLAQFYAAADITAVPSLQESFGLIAAESLACGSPVVAFATSGLLDIVDHEQNGYLAQPFEIADLAHGITWLLQDQTRRASLATRGREKVERDFDLNLQAARYLALYDELLS